MFNKKQQVTHVKLEFEHISLWLPPEKASWGQRFSALLPNNGSTQRQQPQGKQLLDDVSGHALPGRMLAVMGPSGAGKTTLLGVLAGDRSTLNSGKMTGKVLLGGRERKLEKFRQISAHVKQDDILLPTTTPREALQFAAALRLPTPHFTKQQQAAAVARLIDGMKLDNCADTLVGDATAGMKGLSGGERRRLANAVELLGGPAVFLSDEPTSGQDSSTAVQVLQYMKHQINGAGGVLIITLHQPGSEVSSLVDDLMLLGYGGRPVFMGPWGAALPYFTGDLGLQLPPHTGLADWLLALLDKEAHIVQQHQRQVELHSLGGGKLSSNGGHTFIDYCNAFGGSIMHTCSCSSSCSNSGGGVFNSGHITLHAHSGSTTCSSTDSFGLSTMAAAWRQYQASGRAAAAAAPYLPADTPCIMSNEFGSNELSAFACQQPGLSEITEGSANNDADIVITTVVLDSTEESASAVNAQIYTVPAPRSHSIAVAGAAACPSAYRRAGRGVVSATWAMQVKVLACRALRWWLRNPAMLLSEFGQYLFVVLFLGSLYPRLPTSGQAAAPDRLAALYLWLTCIMVTTPARALLSWDQERRLLRHEMSSGLYSLTPFLIGTKILVSLPLEVGVVAVTGALLYVLVGFQAVAAKFWAFMALSIFLAVCAANLGNAICLVMTDMHFKLPALCVTATLLLAFAGFVVQAIPVWWSWLGHASFCTYAYAGMVRNEFESLPLQLPLGTAAANALNSQSGEMRSSLASLGLGSLAAAAGALNGSSNKTVLVDGLSMVPRTVHVHMFNGVGGFLGVGAAFAVGSSIIVLLMTVLVVRLRRQ